MSDVCLNLHFQDPNYIQCFPTASNRAPRTDYCIIHTASKGKAEHRGGRLQTVLPWAQRYSRVTAQTPLPNSQLRHTGLWKEKGFKKHSWMSYQICSQGSLMLKLFLFKICLVHLKPALKWKGTWGRDPAAFIFI